MTPIPNGTRVRVMRWNGEQITGTTFGPLPWLLPIGEYYHIMMDNPVTVTRAIKEWEYDADDPKPRVKPNRQKKRVKETYTVHGTYHRDFITIL